MEGRGYDPNGKIGVNASCTIPADHVTMHQLAIIKNGSWHEVGAREMQGKPSVQFH